nr:ribonuclease H-like domain-containing protein [Tanacetum cinerariifolium]
MELKSTQTSTTAKLPMLKQGDYKMWRLRIEQYFQEDLNLKFLRSLPSEWNTHVVVWMNKSDLDTMSIDYLYNNFKIVEQEDWESVRKDEVESPPEIERKIVKPSMDKVEVDIPKQNDKLDRRPIKYAEMLGANTIRGKVWPVNPKRSFQRRTTYNNKNFFQKVNTAKGKVNTARPNLAVLNVVRANKDKAGHSQKQLEDQGYFNSRCSRYMTGNISYLTDFKEIDGGYVAFGGGAKGGNITGKGIIRAGKLNFEDVYFVKELKFNLFSVS